MAGDMHGGHAWQGACMAGGMHDTINEQVVRILLEGILVMIDFYISKLSLGNILISFCVVGEHLKG